MSADEKKLRAEATIYERFGGFKAVIMRLIHDNFDRHQSIFSLYAKLMPLYCSLQLGISTLGVSGIAMRKKDSDSGLYCCFSRGFLKFRQKIRRAIASIAASECHSIRRHKISIQGNDINIIIVPVNGDTIFLINPHKPADQDDSLSTAWFPVAATYRELIRQYCTAATRWTYNAGEEWWREAEEANETLGRGKDDNSNDGTMETITISLDLRKSTFAMEQAKENQDFATWMSGLITKLTGHAQKCGAIFDKFTGDGVIVHFAVNPPWEKKKEGEDVLPQTLTKALRCAAQLVSIVEDELPGLRKILHNSSGKFGAGVGMAFADAQWDVDTNGQFMVVGKGVVGACRAADDAHAGKIRLVNSAYQPISAIPGVKLDRFRLKSFKTKEFSKDLDVSVWEVNASEVDSALPR
jgi:class 3 adenylate cyclase